MTADKKKVKKKKEQDITDPEAETEPEGIILEIMTPAIGVPKMRTFKSEWRRWREIKKIVKFYYNMKECKDFHLYKLDKGVIRMTMR